mgnify:CR=1 FL=1
MPPTPDEIAAFKLASEPFPGWFGVFYQVPHPTKNEKEQKLIEAMRAAAREQKGIIAVAEDPIVSSDVIGNSSSLLFDIKGTLKAGSNIIKTLSWYENLGHAARLLDVVRLYGELDLRQEGVK